MEKRSTPIWILWGIMSLLIILNFILVAALGWQYTQNRRLRQQLASLGINKPEGTATVDAYVKLYSDQDYKGEVLTVVPSQVAPDKQGLRGDIEFFAAIQPDNATTKDFNDKASSAIYFLPKGWTVVLFQDANFKNRQLRLVGTGNEERIRDFRDADPPFNDKATSLRWIQE